MSSYPPSSAPSLANMPEEILSQIISSLLPLKWYSLSVLVSLSRTNSYLRQWLMEDDTIWHLALLGRGMGRPLHTIPGYLTDEDYGSGPPGSKTGVGPPANGHGNGMIKQNGSQSENGDVKFMNGTAIIKPNGEVDILAETNHPLPGYAPGSFTSPTPITLTSASLPAAPTTGGGGKKKKNASSAAAKLDYTNSTTPEQAQAAIIKASGLPSSAFTFGTTSISPDGAKAGAGTISTAFTVKFDKALAASLATNPGEKGALAGLLAAGAGVGVPAATGDAAGDAMAGFADVLEHGLSVAASKGKGKEPSKAPAASISEVQSILSSGTRRTNPVPLPLPSNKPPALTFRDLGLQIYTHEAGCVNCKVADSKLSHYFMTDGEMLRSAEGMGVMKGVVDQMRKLPGGKGWGDGKIVKGSFERVIEPKEASTLSIRTSKFFAGYDSFGHCAHTLPIRISTKSELLTTPPLARIEISVFIPARKPVTVTQVQGGVMTGQPDVMLVSGFVVENWGGVTLGDFQWSFAKWASSPMTQQEITDFENKGYYGATRAGKTTRDALIPSTYGRFRKDDKLYEVGDIRPLGQRIENGRGAILLGYKYPGN